jgi:hypothetical protein
MVYNFGDFVQFRYVGRQGRGEVAAGRLLISGNNGGCGQWLARSTHTHTQTFTCPSLGIATSAAILVLTIEGVEGLTSDAVLARCPLTVTAANLVGPAEPGPAAGVAAPARKRVRRKQGGQGGDDRSIFTCPVCNQDVDGGVPALARHLKEEHLGDGGGGGTPRMKMTRIRTRTRTRTAAILSAGTARAASNLGKSAALARRATSSVSTATPSRTASGTPNSSPRRRPR